MSERIQLDMDLPDHVVERLRDLATSNGRSIAEEAKVIIAREVTVRAPTEEGMGATAGTSAIDATDEAPLARKGLAQAILEIVEPYGGFDVPEAVWPPDRPVVKFD